MLGGSSSGTVPRWASCWLSRSRVLAARANERKKGQFSGWRSSYYSAGKRHRDFFSSHLFPSLASCRQNLILYHSLFVPSALCMLLSFVLLFLSLAPQLSLFISLARPSAAVHSCQRAHTHTHSLSLPPSPLSHCLSSCRTL